MGMKTHGYTIEPKADLYRANLYGANLYGANLYGANLYGANLYGADLHGADLHGADLYRANMYGANLYGADLHGADLREADLSGADLREADLHGADLREADLSGADLREADLHVVIGAIVLPVDDQRGYRCIAVWGNQSWTIYAGCRTFSVKMALTHWDPRAYPGPEHQAMRYCLAIAWLLRYGDEIRAGWE